ncbi:MAG: diguanylate cyclase [Rhodocyclales bacterium]|nr:diguanylate cyclase [Rhodocyclales bacterium]
MGTAIHVPRSVSAPRTLDSIHSIGTKLTLAISLVIALGFGTIVAFYTQQQEKNILLQNERALNQVLDSVNQGLQTVMITASADVARLYADKLKGVKDIDEIRIVRPNGLEAFRDNTTIRQVNDYRDTTEFTPRPAEEVKQVFAADNENLQRAIRSQQLVYYYDIQHGDQHLTFLLPIKNLARCKRCHGREQEVLGVLEVRSQLDAVREQVRETWVQSIAVLAISLAAVLLVAGVVLRRYIVRPIEVVSLAMSRVAARDLDQQIPVMGQDELSSLALSFNSLTEELRQRHAGFNAEHNKLETILMSADEGIVVTDSSGKIVLLNPAAEKLLDKPAARIIDDGLLRLFDDPDRVESALGHAGGVSTNDIFIYHGRHLAAYASTLRRADGSMLGHAVLIRDMTEEKHLEQRLRDLSNTDALTGLLNRRALDETLKQEFGLALEQDRDLSVMMFDIDHFKKFNDNYGHDQGDRVLKKFATVALSCVREDLDTLCRYGGEEFTLITRETSEEGALILAERIRCAVEAMEVDGLKVTTSIGVAGIRESGALKPAELIERADAALYDAKRGGRNRVAAMARRGDA